ncbi:MAG: MBL fold metallo-hydrolase [Gammaproteobacteria bacterium]|nr:MBL fold metallo-hydrolase [Gammaproteobacteria bacterium]MCK5262573.1 MBL fold metallo-hydrolase [Gammaproteobacteria bacterium]
MIITFYGVRGSAPTPGPTTLKYGGNTSCVHLALDNGQDVILDAGTGMKKLGLNLLNKTTPINIILSHVHWDHIQGYPFFSPIFQTERQIDVFSSTESNDRAPGALFKQMDGVNFPVTLDQLPSKNNCIFDNVETILQQRNIHITKKPLNHPGGGTAYRFEEDGMSCAYVTDNELDPPDKVHTSYDEWVNFLHGVDVLIHDAQYTEEDMPHKHGWGHSLISQVRQLAIDAEVGTLVMFHHDPDRSDAELDEVQIENEAHFKNKRNPTQSICAAEGMQIKLSRPIIGGDTLVEIL